MTTTPHTYAHTESVSGCLLWRAPLFILTDTIKCRSLFSTRPRHQNHTASLLSHHPARKPGCKWGWRVTALMCVFVCKWWGSGAYIKTLPPITIKSRWRIMEETEEEEVACHRQDILQKSLVLHIPERCFCLSSAKGRLVRHLNTRGSIWRITGIFMSGSFWTVIPSCQGPYPLNLNFTHFNLTVSV